MSRFSPIPEADAPDDVAQLYGRVKDMLGSDELPEPFLVYGNVHSFLRDFYMNFKKFIWSDGALDAKTHAIIAFATACHSKNKFWTNYFEERCIALGGTKEELGEIVAVVATNYTYNTFFKFRANSGTDRFDGMGVGLRAHVFAGVSLDEKLVELLNIAISNLNACQPCTSSHVMKAGKLGLSDDEILEAVQCAATIYSGCLFESAAA